MLLANSINTLMGIIISSSVGIIDIYVKNYFNGSGRVSTIAGNLHSIPWTVKFIYGILIDTLVISIKTKLNIIRYLPVAITLLNLIPIFFKLSTLQFYFFCLCVSIPISLTQCIIFAFFYQEISMGKYTKAVLSDTIYYNFMGRLVGIIMIWILGLIFSGKLNVVITITYAIVTISSLLLIIFNYLLHKELEQQEKINENVDSTENYLEKNEIKAVEGQQDELECKENKTGIERLKETLKGVALFLKDDVMWRFIAFLFIFGLIPTYMGYTRMFILAKTKRNGLGITVEFNNFLRVVFYLGTALGPKIYKTIMARTNPTEEKLTKEKRRTMIFSVLYFGVFYTFFSELLFYLPKGMNMYVKGLVYALFSITGAIYSGMWTNGIMEIMSDKCVQGLEGCVFSIWSSAINFSGVMSDTIGLWVISFCRNRLGVGSEGDFITLIPATYISFLVNVGLLLSGYLIH